MASFDGHKELSSVQSLHHRAWRVIIEAVSLFLFLIDNNDGGVISLLS